LLALASGLRLWRIGDLFNAVHDYDPGTHALAGRFIAEGLVPYRDFVSVHPPLYDLALGALFRVFGYDYCIVQCLSVVFSLGSVVLIYFVARRLYGGLAGLIAALLLAVEPMMVYFGRRGVQEAMGLFLILVAALLALRWLDGRRFHALLWCGFALGLAVATKYVFAPVAIALGIALSVLSLPDAMWRAVRGLGSLQFWGAYGLIACGMYGLLLSLRLVADLMVPLPFIDALFATPEHVAVSVMVFLVPLLVLWRHWVPILSKRDGLRALFRAVATRRLWIWGAGVALGFLVVTGYFLVTAPRDFIVQTVLWQSQRATTEVPSLVGIVRLACVSPIFFRMSLLSIVCIVSISLVLLNRRDFGRSDCLLVIVMLVTLLLSQGFYQLPRYYAAALVFALVALAGLAVPNRTAASCWLRPGCLAVIAVLVTGIAVSCGLLRNYSGYDVGSRGGPTERALYDSTNEYLEHAGAEKVFSANPIYPALTGAYESSRSFDTFALWFLQGVPAVEVVEGLLDEGVDYVVVDSWARFWMTPPYSDQVDDVVGEVRRQASLVALIEPGMSEWVEIYQFGAAPATLVNGTFAYWADYAGAPMPLGWNPVLVGGQGDSADIRAAGLNGEGGVRLVVYEDGFTEGDATSTHAGLSRRMAFPRTDVRVTVMPGVNTESLGATPLGPAIHFLDGEGHSVILGFSDQIEEEQVAVCGECGHVAVMQPAPLYRWSEHSIDVGKYWLEAGWEVPDEVTLLVVLSAHADYPGYYTFHVGSVTCGSGE